MSLRRIRLNRGGLYPTGQPKQAGYKDAYFDKVCSGCGKKIPKKDSNITIPGEGDFCWDCKLGKRSVKNEKSL